jgi:hypothetical protein
LDIFIQRRFELAAASSQERKAQEDLQRQAKAGGAFFPAARGRAFYLSLRYGQFLAWALQSSWWENSLRNRIATLQTRLLCKKYPERALASYSALHQALRSM